MKLEKNATGIYEMMQMSESKIETILLCFFLYQRNYLLWIFLHIQLTRHSSLKFLNVYGSAFVKEDQIFGQTIEFCNMVMCLGTQHFW